MRVFIPLHNHSDYSLGESTNTVTDLVKQAASMGYPCLALTDHNTVAGFAEFDYLCKEYNVRPIFGLELDVKGIDDLDVLVLLAKDSTGYQNLLWLASEKKPPAADVLQKYRQGLTVLVRPPNLATAIAIINQLRAIYPHEDVYVELLIENQEQRTLSNNLVRLFPAETLMASQNVYYVDPRHTKAVQTLWAIKHKVPFNQAPEPNKPLLLGKIVERGFKKLPQALVNTKKIAEQCQVTLSRETKLPQLPNNQDLRSLALERAAIRYEVLTTQVQKRLDYELQVIIERGLADYFLIVSDIVDYAKQNQIPVGPGRGSAAGSLVAYCLGITEIDPLKYGLFFERFLNKQRHTLPDIDLDICYEKRDQLIQYVVDRFGSKYVAKIGTYGTTGRAAATAQVRKVHGQDEPEIAEALVGLKQYFSTHAAGVLITPKPVITYTGLERSGEIAVTQTAMDGIAGLGLVKIDLLGLRNLTILDQIEQLIKTTEPDFSLAKVTLDDSDTFKLLSSGASLGIFQLESNMFQQLLPDFKPEQFTDLIALLALGRPGPIKQIPAFLKRRSGDEAVEYLTPGLEPILRETYGLMLYQEQVMQVAHEIADFTLEEADFLRVAMSKKNRQVMEELKRKFITGCSANGLSYQQGNQLYLQMESFADYAFNKAHSAAYALITYRLAYLKTHYPQQFYVAQLTHATNTEKTGEFYLECMMRDIAILPPDVRYSDNLATIEGNSLRIGLACLKGIGMQVSNEIIKQRNIQQFTSLNEFMVRSKLPNRTMVTLCYGGALDGFGKRAVMARRLTEQKSGSDVVDDEFGLLRKEQSILGIYLSGHPVQVWSNFLERISASLGSYVAGEITHSEEHYNRIQGKITGFQLENRFVFHSKINERQRLLTKSEFVALFGNYYNHELVVDWVLPLVPMLLLKPDFSKISELQKFLVDHHGNTPVILNIQDKTLQIIESQLWLDMNEVTLQELRQFCTAIKCIDPWAGRKY